MEKDWQFTNQKSNKSNKQNWAELWHKLNCAMGRAPLPWAARGPVCLGHHSDFPNSSMMALHHLDKHLIKLSLAHHVIHEV